MTGAVLHIHAGLPKTGTSALQRFLIENREALAARGLLVPQTGQRGDGPHHTLFSRMGGIGSRLRETDVLVAEIRAAGLPGAVVSSEYAPLLLRSGLLGLSLARLRRRGLCIRFHIWLRPQADLLNSAYPELLRTLLDWRSFQDFVAERRRAGWRGFAALLHRLERASDLPPVVHPFTAGARRRGLWRDFLEGLGQDADGPFADPGEVNASLGPVGTHVAGEIVQRIAAGGLVRGYRNRVALRDRLRAATLDFPREPEPFRGVDAALRDEVRRATADENERLAQRLWGRSWDTVFAEENARPLRPNLWRPEKATRAETEIAELMREAAWTACRKAVRRYAERNAARRLRDRLMDPADRLMDLTLRLGIARG